PGSPKINQHCFFGFQNFVLKRIVGYFFNSLVHSCSSFLLQLTSVRNARNSLPLIPHLLLTSLPKQALLAQFFSRLQELVAESRAGHCPGQTERAVHQREQGDCLFVAFASSINHLSECFDEARQLFLESTAIRLARSGHFRCSAGQKAAGILTVTM